MKPKGPGRVWKKDITYCEPGKRLYKVPHTKKGTGGLKELPDEKRVWPRQ